MKILFKKYDELGNDLTEWSQLFEDIESLLNYLNEHPFKNCIINEGYKIIIEGIKLYENND